MKAKLQGFLSDHNIHGTPFNSDVNNINEKTFGVNGDESIISTSLLLIQAGQITQIQNTLALILKMMGDNQIATSQKIDLVARNAANTAAAIRDTVTSVGTKVALLNAGQFHTPTPPPPKPEPRVAKTKQPQQQPKNQTDPASSQQTPAAAPDQQWKKVEKKAKATKPAPLPSASRRIFAMRESPAPLANAEKLVTTLPATIAKVMKESGYTKPITLTVGINDTNGTMTITTDKETPASTLSLYLGHITRAVLEGVNTPDNPYDLFRLAPTTVELALDMVPNVALNNMHPLLLHHEINEQLMLAKNVPIESARYIQPDEHKRNYREDGTKKRYCTIVIRCDVNEAKKLEESVHLYSRSVKVRKMVTVTAATQCKKCMEFGHHTTLCKNEQNTCGICSGDHPTAKH
jgi:hypothetical protein